MLTLLLGVGFFAVSYCFAGRFGAVWILRIVPAAAAAAEVVFRWSDRKNGVHRPPSAWRTLAQKPTVLLLFGFCCLVFSFYISIMNADPTVVGEVFFYQDLLWNVGNAQAFKLAFPPQDIRFSMVRLAYHYLTELCVGALSWASGVSAYRVVAFYMAFPVLAAVLLCIWQMGMVCYQSNEKKSLALCALTLFGGTAGLWTDFLSVGGVTANTLLIHVITNINAQSTAIIFISIFTAMFTLLCRSGFSCSWIEGLVFLAAVFMMTFAKGPEAAIVICAFVIVMLIVLIAQRPKCWAKALVLTVLSVAVFAVIYFMVFSSGANTSVKWVNNSVTDSLIGGFVNLTPPYTWQRKVAVALGGVALALLMQPFQTFVYLTTLPKDALHVFQLPPERLLARGVAVGGIMAYCMLWHESSSQIYFAFAAFFFMNLLAIDLFGELRRKWLKGAAGVLLCIGVVSAVCCYAGVFWRGSVQFAANQGWTTVTSWRSSPAYAEDIEAMEWLGDNMPASDRFATNRIHAAAWRTDGISNLYSAFSGRQAYMEGYTYAYTNEGVSEPVINERIRNNELLFSDESTAEQIRSVCAEIGVQWLVYSVPYPGSDSHLAENFPLMYENEAVRIYKVS